MGWFNPDDIIKFATQLDIIIVKTVAVIVPTSLNIEYRCNFCLREIVASYRPCCLYNELLDQNLGTSTTGPWSACVGAPASELPIRFRIPSTLIK